MLQQDFIQSTGYSTIINNLGIVDVVGEIQNMRISQKSTGHSAMINNVSIVDENECKIADFAKSTGHSATVGNLEEGGGCTDRIDCLVASAGGFSAGLGRDIA